MELSFLSLNQQTTPRWSLREAVDGCVRCGIPWIDLSRIKVAEIGLKKSVRIIRSSGLKVSGLCFAGLFPATSNVERAARIDENRRAIDEAAEIGTDALVLVGGPLNGCELDAARAMVEEGIQQLIPYAEAAKVKLGIEPLHPVFAADRSVIVTLGQANDLVERLASPQVGVVIDVYHVWWDPELYNEIRRAAGKIVGFHVNDWVVPIVEPLTSRGMMGDGAIDNRRIRQAIQESGYNGPVEVEIFNKRLWETPYDDVLKLIKARFIDCV